MGRGKKSQTSLENMHFTLRFVHIFPSFFLLLLFFPPLATYFPIKTLYFWPHALLTVGFNKCTFC